MTALREQWTIVGAAVALALSAWLLVHSLASPMARAEHERIVQKAHGAPPAPEPLVFEQLAPDRARAINAATPFASDRGPQARPFVLAAAPDTTERAVDCLASAMWYEAGDDAQGELAVGQVVLNRVRHPAFPSSVCGVVFQGSERATGCQFTFTCDGALHRVPSADALDRARGLARAMLAGTVVPEVGLSTHYHTDWVHPAWSQQLDKIARVGTHLFFRWRGWWGGPRALRQPYAGAEPITSQLAFLSPAHRPPEAPAAFPTGEEAMVAAAAMAQLPGPVDLGDGRYRVTMSPARNGNVQAVAALELCGNRDFCRITGVLIDYAPRPTVVFTYLRDRAAAVERVRWDCTRFRRPTAAQCMAPGEKPADERAGPGKPASAPVAVSGRLEGNLTDQVVKSR